MNRDKISVIVPVYKVEKYIEKCLDSLLCQTYSDIEIICVDDNTPDNSAEICKKYSMKDSRVKLVSKKQNEGLASARNTGICFASGKYIAFVDSDDWVVPDYLETLYTLLIDNDADIAQGSYLRLTAEIMETNIEDRREEISSVTGKEALYKMFTAKIVQPDIEYTVVWNKLYSKNLIDNIRFIEGKIFEDQYFSGRCFYNCKKVVTTNKILYFYRKNIRGITMQNYNIKFLDELDMHRELIKYFNMKKEKDLANLIAARCVPLAIDHYLRGVYYSNYDITKKSYLSIFKNYVFYLRNKNVSLLYKIEIFLFIICPTVFLNLETNVYYPEVNK